jgi:hypothetical protein
LDARCEPVVRAIKEWLLQSLHCKRRRASLNRGAVVPVTREADAFSATALHKLTRLDFALSPRLRLHAWRGRRRAPTPIFGFIRVAVAFLAGLLLLVVVVCFFLD